MASSILNVLKRVAKAQIRIKTLFFSIIFGLGRQKRHFEGSINRFPEFLICAALPVAEYGLGAAY
jgi:hypothetical protein